MDATIGACGGEPKTTRRVAISSEYQFPVFLGSDPQASAAYRIPRRGGAQITVPAHVLTGPHC
jgi:hypothetical protein